jgi:DNA-binding CsgD family transcriptional regulator
MRDRSPRETALSAARALSKDEPRFLASFAVGGRSFELCLCLDKCTQEPTEVARFSLGSHTLAVVEHRDPDQSAAEAQEIIARLTERELQIAAMVAQGDATKNIAYKLRISEWTVGTHLRRIFAKLHVDNRAAMVYRCASLIKNVGQPRSLRSNIDAPQPKARQRRELACAD